MSIGRPSTEYITFQSVPRRSGVVGELVVLVHGRQSAKIFGTPFDYETEPDLIDALVTMADHDRISCAC